MHWASKYFLVNTHSCKCIATLYSRHSKFSWSPCRSFMTNGWAPKKSPLLLAPGAGGLKQKVPVGTK